MKKSVSSMSVKSLSLILAGVLIFECSAPAFAQLKSDAKGYDWSNMAYTPQNFVQQEQIADLDQKIYEAYAKQNGMSRQGAEIMRNVEEQKNIIKPITKKLEQLRAEGKAKYGEVKYPMYVSAAGRASLNELTQHLVNFLGTFFLTGEVLSYADFEKEYNAYIKKEAQDYIAQNNISTPAPYENSVDLIVEELVKQFPPKKVYAEYLQNAKEDIKWRENNKVVIEEAGYIVLREYVKAYGPESITLDAARILLNLKLNGKSVITDIEKTKIARYVTARLTNQNLDLLNVGLLSSKKEEKIKVASVLVGDIIEAITLGAYVVTPDNNEYANAVANLIYKSDESIAFPHFFNVGFSALLALNRHDKLDDILYKYNERENETPSVLDLLSFQAPVAAIQNAKGEFLRGKPSKSAQYTTKYSYGNAFYDAAMILAEDESPASAKLLKKYSGEKGFRAIMPFLAGALISGKAGFEKSEHSVKANLEPNAYNAARMANLYLGDIEAAQEYDLDRALLRAYPSIKEKLSNNAITTEALRADKQDTRSTYAFYDRAAISGDILFMVWATFDLARMAGKVISLSKATYISIKTLRIADPTARAAAKIANAAEIQKYMAFKAKFTSIPGKIRNAMKHVVLGQRSLYTSEALLVAPNASAEASTVTKVLATATYDASKGAYVANASSVYREANAIKSGAARRKMLRDITRTNEILNEAANTAKQNYANRSFFNKYKSYRSYLSSATYDAFSASKKITGAPLEAGLNFAYDIKKAGNITAPLIAKGPNSINWLSRPLGAKSAPGTLEMFHRATPASEAAPLPVNITIEKKIPSINSEKVSNVLLTGNDDKFLLSLEHDNKLVNPSFFKMLLSDDSFVSLARMSREIDVPLSVKFMGEHTSRIKRFQKGWSEFFTSKDKLFSGTGTVFIREGGVLKTAPIKVSTAKDFDGVKILINQDNSISVLGRDKFGVFKNFDNPYSFSLPKGELSHFVKYAQMSSFNNPLNISLTGARNKMNLLYAIQFLSLSAASSSLIGPLRENFPEMTNTQEALVSVVFPYAASFLSPFWAPFVKRFGAANMMKVSLGIAAGALTYPMLRGYYGFGDVNKRNPDRPSLTPLMIGASLVGLSSSLTRATQNPLLDAIGGGAGQFKSFMFKNCGVFIMIAPTAVIQQVELFSPRYYTNADGSTLMEKGKPVVHPRFDFSLYNPILLAATGTILYKFHKARMPNIGKVSGYTMSSNVRGINEMSSLAGLNKIYRPVAGVLSETVGASKVMFKKDVMPYTLAAIGALGVESSLFNKYSQAEANEYAKGFIKDNNTFWDDSKKVWKPVIATAWVVGAQFFVRKNAKPILKMFGGDNPASYGKLAWASLGMAGAGSLILANEDGPWAFTLGSSLVGMGFANTTTAFKMLGQSKLKSLGYAKSVVTDWNVAFPAVHVGMAFFPALHNIQADSEVENNPANPTKVQAMQNTMEIPLYTLGGSIAAYAYGADVPGVRKSANFLKHGLAFGLPYSRLKDWSNNNFGYKPAFNMPEYKSNSTLKPLELKPLAIPASLSDIKLEEPVQE